MPNIKSAEKRVLVNKRNQLRNRSIKTGLKNSMKKYAAAEDKSALLPKATSTVDRAASKGVIHKNKANRMKAQIAKAAKA